MHLRHVLYLCVYILTGAANSLLVKRSQVVGADGARHYAYQPVAVTFCVSASKLLLTAIYVLFFQQPTVSPLSTLSSLLQRASAFRLFFIPAALYFGFDILAFFNLQRVQPATFRLLINLKVLFSGLLLYVILGQRLTARQWVALVILVAACGIEQWDSFDTSTGLIAITMICVQALCSSSAGVYFQFLLQSKRTAAAADLGLWEKNVFLYTWALLFNIIYLGLFSPATLLHPLAATATFDANVIPIVLTSAVGGFCTSLILRDLDVIIKEYANFAEMCVVVIGAWAWLGTEVHVSLLVAVAMVTLSLYLYNVSGAPPASAPSAAAGKVLELQEGAVGRTDKLSEPDTADVEEPLLASPTINGRHSPSSLKAPLPL